MIADYLAEELNHNKEGTVRVKRNDIIHMARWWAKSRPGDAQSITSMTPRTFKRFIRDCINDDLAPSTVHNRYNSAKTFFDWLANEGVDVETNDEEESVLTKRVTKRQRKTMNGRSKKEVEAPFDFYLEPDEVERLIEHVPRPKLRNQLLVRLMFSCGFRVGEVATLRTDRLDLDDRSATVDNLKAGSGQRLFRTGYFRGNVERLARLWLRTGRPDVFGSDESEYLFPSDRAEHISAGRVGDMVKEAATHAGMQDVLYADTRGRERHKITAHTLRHSFAVHCVKGPEGKGGMDIKNLKDLMGHTGLKHYRD